MTIPSLSQTNVNPISVRDVQFAIKSDIRQSKSSSRISSTRQSLIDSADVILKRSIELASE